MNLLYSQLTESLQEMNYKLKPRQKTASQIREQMGKQTTEQTQFMMQSAEQNN